MIYVDVSQTVRLCQHCGAKNIKRTFHIKFPKLDVYLGRICIQKITGVTTSGNPYKAAGKIQKYFNRINIDERLETYEALIDGLQTKTS